MERKDSKTSLLLGIVTALLAALLSVGSADARPRTLPSSSRAEVILPQDVERARGRYALAVPGKGTLLVKQVKAPGGSKSCRVHRPSLIDKLAALPELPSGPSWVQVGVVEVPEELGGGLLCIGDGNGCYILVGNGSSD